MRTEKIIMLGMNGIINVLCFCLMNAEIPGIWNAFGLYVIVSILTGFIIYMISKRMEK